MASRTEFQTRPRREDTRGHMIVFQALEFLRDAFDKLRNNRAVGNAIVGVGNTFVDVILVGASFATTPTIAITPTVDPGVGMRYWISNKTAVSFRINLSAAAPVGGISFDYQAVNLT